jgi:hypothetical protein
MRKTETQNKTSSRLRKVERGGEVQPDEKDKGSDPNVRRHKYGVPKGAARQSDLAEEDEGQRATEDKN